LLLCIASLAFTVQGAGAVAQEISGDDRALLAIEPLTSIRVDPRIEEGQPLPEDAAEDLFLDVQPYSRAAVRRTDWMDMGYYWAANELFYHPLYFEQPLVERYGHTISPLLQPTVNGVHFFASTLALPVKLIGDYPFGYATPLGVYRPGSDTPPLREGIRLGADCDWLHPLRSMRRPVTY
jgi:hypothetical protein